MSCAQRFELCAERRRGHRARQQAHAVALLARGNRDRGAQLAPELVPRRHASTTLDSRGAIGVVHVKYACLCERVRGTKARRVGFVAFDLRRAAHVVFHEHANGARGPRHRGGKVQRRTRHHRLGVLRVGVDALFRLLGAGVETRERQRRTHQLQHDAAIRRDGQEIRLLRVFALQPILEAFGAGVLLQALPVVLARLGGEVGCRAGVVVHGRLEGGGEACGNELD